MFCFKWRKRYPLIMFLLVYPCICSADFSINDNGILANVQREFHVHVCVEDVSAKIKELPDVVTKLEAITEPRSDQRRKLSFYKNVLASNGFMYFMSFRPAHDPFDNLRIDFAPDDEIFVDIGNFEQRIAGDLRRQDSVRNGEVVFFQFELDHMIEQEDITIGLQSGTQYKVFEFDTKGLDGEIPTC